MKTKLILVIIVMGMTFAAGAQNKFAEPDSLTLQAMRSEVKKGNLWSEEKQKEMVIISLEKEKKQLKGFDNLIALIDSMRNHPAFTHTAELWEKVLQAVMAQDQYSVIIHFLKNCDCQGLKNCKYSRTENSDVGGDLSAIEDDITPTLKTAKSMLEKQIAKHEYYVLLCETNEQGTISAGQQDLAIENLLVMKDIDKYLEFQTKLYVEMYEKVKSMVQILEKETKAAEEMAAEASRLQLKCNCK